METGNQEINLWTGTLLVLPLIKNTLISEQSVYHFKPEGEWEIIGHKKELEDIKNFEHYENILTPILMQYKAWEDHCWDVGDITYFCAKAVLKGLINNDSDNYVVLFKKK